MLTSHPAGSPEAVHHRANAAQSLASCAEHCSACADACLAEDTVADLRRCIRMDLDCADACRRASAACAALLEAVVQDGVAP